MHRCLFHLREEMDGQGPVLPAATDDGVVGHLTNPIHPAQNNTKSAGSVGIAAGIAVSQCCHIDSHSIYDAYMMPNMCVLHCSPRHSFRSDAHGLALRKKRQGSLPIRTTRCHCLASNSINSPPWLPWLNMNRSVEFQLESCYISYISC